MLFISLLILSGCASPYQKEGLTGGYSDMRVRDNVFRVSFKGNRVTSEQRVIDLAHVRAAEVTLQNGYKYFIILDQGQFVPASPNTTPATANTSGMVNANNYGIFNIGATNGTYAGGKAESFANLRITLTIACFAEKPQTGSLLYDAQQVLSNLGAAYRVSLSRH